MPILSSTIVSCHYNCCTDGSTSPRNYGSGQQKLNHPSTTKSLVMAIPKNGWASKDNLASERLILFVSSVKLCDCVVLYFIQVLFKVLSLHICMHELGVDMHSQYCESKINAGKKSDTAM
jgi:hypothetical protein